MLIVRTPLRDNSVAIEQPITPEPMMTASVWICEPTAEFNLRVALSIGLESCHRKFGGKLLRSVE
jgi:hypothetical protein